MKNYDSLEELERLLKVWLEEWFLHEKNEQSQPKPVVTITQEPGCGAETIAERLCSELDLHLYDWELVEQIAKDEQVSAQLVSTLEKNPPSGFADFLAGLAPEYGLSSNRYISSLKRILLSIAVTGNAVIMGRGSNFFLPPEKKIGLCFVAPRERKGTSPFSPLLRPMHSETSCFIPIFAVAAMAPTQPLTVTGDYCFASSDPFFDKLNSFSSLGLSFLWTFNCINTSSGGAEDGSVKTCSHVVLRKSCRKEASVCVSSLQTLPQERS